MRRFPFAHSMIALALVSGALGVSVLANALPLLAGLILGGAAAAAAALGQGLGDLGRLVPAYLPVRQRPTRPQPTDGD